MATVDADGTWIEFVTSHFTAFDVNLPPPPGPNGPKAGGGGGDGGGGGPGPPPNQKKPPKPPGPPKDSHEPIPPGEPEDPKFEDPCLQSADHGGSSIGRATGALRIDFSIPGLIVKGAESELAFVYDSTAANPHVYLTSWLDTSDVTDPDAYPEKIGFSWMFEGSYGEAVYAPHAEGSGQDLHYASVLVDAVSPLGDILPTGLYPYWVNISCKYPGNDWVYAWAQLFGQVPIPGDNSPVPLRVPYFEPHYLVGTTPVVNHQQSPFGAGWSIAGMMEVYSDEVSGDHMIVSDGRTFVVNGRRKLAKFAGSDDGWDVPWNVDGLPKLNAGISEPSALAAGPDGSVYLAEPNRIRRISPAGLVEPVAGCGSYAECSQPPPGTDTCIPSHQSKCDFHAATQVFLSGVRGLRVDSSGRVFFTEKHHNLVRMIDATGALQTLVGNVPKHINQGIPVAAYQCDQDALNTACRPTGLEIEETESGTFVYFAARDELNQVAGAVRRRKVGYAGLAEVTPDLGEVPHLLEPENILLLEPGKLLVAAHDGRMVTLVQFDPVSGVSTADVANVVGNGVDPNGAAQEGVGFEIAIGYPTALARGADGAFYVSARTADDRSYVMRADPMGDLYSVSVIAGSTAKENQVQVPGEPLKVGEDAADVELGTVRALLWRPEERELLISQEDVPLVDLQEPPVADSIWATDESLGTPDSYYTSLIEVYCPALEAYGWLLKAKDGSKYGFNPAGKLEWAKNIQGDYTEYEYDESDHLVLVKTPGALGYRLEHAGDGSTVMIELVKDCGATPESCSLIEEGEGHPTTLTIDGEGDLVVVDLPERPAARYEYQDHLLVKRYEGELNPTADRYVRYEYNGLGMVKKVFFKNQGAAEHMNRQYVHSRELGLADADPGQGTYENPIPQPEDVAWDTTIDALLRQTRTKIDLYGRLMEAVLPSGRWLLYVRDADDRLTNYRVYETEEAAEPLVEVEVDYDEWGHIISKSIGNSVWTYGYDLVPVTDDEGEVIDLTLYSSVIAPTGELTRYVYDDEGNISAVEWLVDWMEDQETGEITYDTKHVSRMYYDDPGEGLLTYYCDPSCVGEILYGTPPEEEPSCVDLTHCRIAFGYDAKDNLDLVEPAGGDKLELTRNALGSVTGITSPFVVDGEVVSSEWTVERDPWGNPTKVYSGPAGAGPYEIGPWELSYSSALSCSSCGGSSGGAKLQKIVAPDGAAMTFLYDVAGKVTDVAMGPDGGVDVTGITITRDLIGKLTDIVINGTDTALNADYFVDTGKLNYVDVAGLGEDDGEDGDWSYQYDTLNRITDVAAPDGGAWHYEYDGVLGLSSTEETTEGRKTTFQRDVVGRMTKRILGPQGEAGGGPAWEYVYDSVGSFIKLTDPKDTEPGDGTTLPHNESGEITKIVRDGQTVDTSSRDIQGRLTWLSRTDGPVKFRYLLDYDSAGALARVTGKWIDYLDGEAYWAGSIRHTYGYSQTGQLNRIEMRVPENGDFVAEYNLRLDCGYDTSGRLSTVTLNEGSHQVLLDRDEVGRLDLMEARTRNEAGELVAANRTSIGYQDPHMRLANIKSGEPVGEDGIVLADVLDLEYGYDTPGRITSMQEGTFARTFAYDDVSRLTGAVDNVTPSRVFEYEYNTVGERTRRVAPGLDGTYTWDDYGVLQSAGGTTFFWDDAGNLLSYNDGAETTQFEYDSSGRVKKVTRGDHSYTYRYGPAERRIMMVENDGGVKTTTRYFSDGLITYELAEVDGQAQPSRAYVFAQDGFTPLMLLTFKWEQNSRVVDEIYFYHNDHLSTPRVVTDDQGTVVWRARYEPFGGEGDNPDPDIDNGDIGIEDVQFDQPLRFPGQWADGFDGVWYNWHRFYLPEYGMYGRRDPLGTDLPWTHPVDHGYVMGNPVMGVDPTGLFLPAPRLPDFLAGPIEWLVEQGTSFELPHMPGTDSYGQQVGTYDELLDFNLKVSVTEAFSAVFEGVCPGASQNVVKMGKGGKLRKKPGKLGQFKGSDALKAENKVVEDVSKKLGLTKDQHGLLHGEISGEGLSGYGEILQWAKEMFDL